MCIRDSLETIATGYVDDCPTPLAEHLWNHRAAAQKRSAHVHAEKKIPIPQVHLVGRLASSPRAHGVDQAIDLSELSEGGLHHCGKGIGIRQIHAACHEVVWGVDQVGIVFMESLV